MVVEGERLAYVAFVLAKSDSTVPASVKEDLIFCARPDAEVREA